MTSLDQRAKAFEDKFAHDESLKFKLYAKRNKLLGQWAADKLNLKGEAADHYIKDVIRSDFEEAGDEDVLRKVYADFTENNVPVNENQLREKMLELLEQVASQSE